MASSIVDATAAVIICLMCYYSFFIDFIRFEDGTISFLDIISLHHGFEMLQKLTGSEVFDLRVEYGYDSHSTLKVDVFVFQGVC